MEEIMTERQQELEARIASNTEKALVDQDRMLRGEIEGSILTFRALAEVLARESVHFADEAGFIWLPKPGDNDELMRLIELVITQNAPPHGPVNPLYWKGVTEKLFGILKEYGFEQVKDGKQT